MPHLEFYLCNTCKQAGKNEFNVLDMEPCSTQTKSETAYCFCMHLPWVLILTTRELTMYLRIFTYHNGAAIDR